VLARADAVNLLA